MEIYLRVTKYNMAAGGNDTHRLTSHLLSYKENIANAIITYGFGAILANIPIICRRWRVFNLTERGRNFNGIIPYTYIYSRWGYDRFSPLLKQPVMLF